MRNERWKLGNLQQEILKHFFECKFIRAIGRLTQDHESVSHIARSLGRAQPTVFKSIQTLMKNNYLSSVKYWSLYEYPIESRTTGGLRVIYPTDKGAAAAVMLGVSFDQINNLHHYGKVDFHKSIMILRYIKMVLQSPNDQDLILRKAMKYALENNYFEESKIRRRDEMHKIKLFIALEHLDAMGDILTLKQFVNKYEIDKNFLKKHLNKQRLYIDSAIRELD
jgi:hypothetical protein